MFLNSFRFTQKITELFQYGFYGEDWLTFEQLTMVPIQQKLIERSLLTNDEVCLVDLIFLLDIHSIFIQF